MDAYLEPTIPYTDTFTLYRVAFQFKLETGKRASRSPHGHDDTLPELPSPERARLLTYLFVVGNPPPPPTGSPGADPTIKQPLGCDRAVD